MNVVVQISLAPMCLNNATGNGTIRMYGLFGVGVALLKDVHHCGGWTLSFPMLKLCPVWNRLLLAALRTR